MMSTSSHFLKPRLIIPPVLTSIADSFIIDFFAWVLFLSQTTIYLGIKRDNAWKSPLSGALMQGTNFTLQLSYSDNHKTCLILVGFAVLFLCIRLYCFICSSLVSN